MRSSSFCLVSCKNLRKAHLLLLVLAQLFKILRVVRLDRRQASLVLEVVLGLGLELLAQRDDDVLVSVRLVRAAHRVRLDRDGSLDRVIVVLPEVDKRPVKPQLDVLVRLGFRGGLVGRLGTLLECIRLDGAETRILAQPGHAGDELVGPDTRVKDRVQRRARHVVRLPVELVAHAEQEGTQALNERVDALALRDGADERLQVVALVQELGDRLRAVPQPRAEENEIAHHDARPVLLLVSGGAVLDCPARRLRLRARSHHEVAHNQLDQRYLVVLVVTTQGNLASELLRVLTVADKVGEEQTREQRSVRVELRLG